MEQRKYRAFLSYSHRDKKWADRLHRELERYRIPKRLFDAGASVRPRRQNLRPIFRDHDELSSSSSLSNVIREALDDSDALIVICSPSATASRWVNEEIRTFQRLGRGDRIFCLIVDGIPMSGDESECFPSALIHPVDNQGQALTEPEEPIAADASGGKSEWRHAKLMLIAGLLDVGLEELVRRDLHQRNRKMLAIAITASAVAVVMAGLTVFAFLSQAEAERRQADAENLVGFLLGDLREDLHKIGRADLFDSVSGKAMEYFQSLESDDARDEVLAQRAEALRQIGVALQGKSDMTGAMAAFRESLTITGQLVEKNPERLDWSLALAESHFYIGEVHWQRGNLELAGVEFLNQLSVVDGLAAAEPRNPERLAHSGYAWTNYGRVQEISGQYEAALSAYLVVMDTFQDLVDLQPEDLGSKQELGFAHNNLGKLKMSLGKLDESEQHFRNDLKIKKAIFEKDPSNNLWREDLMAGHFWLGKLLLARGMFDEAREQNESVLELLDVLLLNDPQVTRLRQRKAAVQTQLAANCRMTGDIKCASQNVDAALSELSELTNSNPEDVRWLRDQALSRLEAAWQAALAGDHESASGFADSAKKTADQLAGNAPFDKDVRKLVIISMLTQGDVARQAANSGQATGNWRVALDTLGQHFDNSNDPQILELQTRLLSRNGQLSAANTIQYRIAEMGYISPYPWP